MKIHQPTPQHPKSVDDLLDALSDIRAMINKTGYEKQLGALDAAISLVVAHSESILGE